jgi:hypothetical protein
VGLASTLLVLLPGARATAQEGSQGPFLTEAAARLGKLIAKANKDGFIFDENKFSVGGGWLKAGANDDSWVSLYTITLKANTRYRLLAAGDADARDVDLEVRTLDGTVVAKDERIDPEAVVNFTPKATQQFLVRVRLFASRDNVPCLCLAVVMVQK